MTDRVHPSAKPTASGGAAAPAVNGGAAAPAVNGGANPAFPPNKAQLYPRPNYRPQPPAKRRSRRSCCCVCCLATTLTIVILIVLAAIAGAVFYVLYRPKSPSFSVASLQLSKFNLTDTALTSSFNFTLTAYNPNNKITFSYDPISVKILSGDIDIGDGSFPGFVHGKRNTTTLRVLISRSNAPFTDGTDLSPLKSSLKSKNLPLKIRLDTKVDAKIGKVTTSKLGIRVNCDGIKISIPTGKTASSATTSNMKCKIDPRIKIIKWTV